jgi:hypothetical protein
MMRRVYLVPLLTLLVLGLPFYWLFLDNSAPPTSPHPVSIAQLRKLAGSDVNAGPERIHFERVAASDLMGNRVAAGSGLRAMRLPVLAYQLDYASSAPVLIGSGIGRADAETQQAGLFRPQAQARVEAALRGADRLVALAVTDNQLGGLRALAGTAKGKELARQVAEQQRADARGEPYLAAPGLVIIPMPQLRFSARMAYVRTASGREYVFAGDLAPVAQSWKRLRLPARFVTDFGRREHRGAIRAWLLTLRGLKRAAPGLVIVPGHAVPRRSGLTEYFGNYQPDI